MRDAYVHDATVTEDEVANSDAPDFEDKYARQEEDARLLAS